MPQPPSGRDWTVFRVGLTGGIASGKSAVAGMFAELGVPLIDTDLLAREVVEPGTPALAEIVAEFGPAMLRPDGTLDRRALRQAAFADDRSRRRLNAITHPRIVARMESLSRATGGPYQVLVIPLLFESGLESRVDRSVVVDCAEAVQKQRLIDRDGETPESAGRLITAQLERADRLRRADDVIDNSGSLDDTRRQVGELHGRLLKLAVTRTEA